MSRLTSASVTDTGQAQVYLDGNGLKRKRLEQGEIIAIRRCEVVRG